MLMGRVCLERLLVQPINLESSHLTDLATLLAKVLPFLGFKLSHLLSYRWQ